MTAEEFAHIYNAHYPRISRYLLTKVRKMQDSEELAAEVFTTALGAFRRGAEPRHVERWLVGIANRVASRFWSRQKIGETPSEAKLLDVEGEENPESLAIMHLENQRLWKCLDTLSPEHRQVLMLRIVAGLSAHKVGEIMGRTEEATRSLQLRALRALRRHWMEVDARERSCRTEHS